MTDAGIEVLLAADPAEINYLTGYDGWSFYVPQVALVALDEAEPTWIGREIDLTGARSTVFMGDNGIHCYPDALVQSFDAHPMDFVADLIGSLGWAGRVVGVESDGYFLSVRGYAALRRGLPNTRFVEVDRLVNKVRSRKSQAEIAYMRDAARLTDRVMTAAIALIEPGVRQCDVVGQILAMQVSGAEFAGDITGVCPLVLAGDAAATPHLFWSDETFGPHQTVAIEVGAARHHYNVPLTRTIHLGAPPKRLLDIARGVEEGLEAVLAVAGPGVSCDVVHEAWQDCIQRHGLEKSSRIGYSVGLGYPPDWSERTISIRQGEGTLLEVGHTIHIMLGMWMEDRGFSLSETVLVQDRGVDCFSRLPRDIQALK